MDDLFIAQNKSKRPFWIQLFLTVSVFIILIVINNRYKQIQSNDFIKGVFEKELAERGEELNTILDGVIEDLLVHQSFKLEETTQELDEIGAMMYLFQNDSLLSWSSNLIDLFDIQILETNPIVQLNNGWYKIQKVEKDGILVYGLLLLKNEFAYRNEYLVPDFKSEVALNASCQISLIPGELNINDPTGKFLFSITCGNTREIKPKQALILFIFYQLLILLLLSLVIKFYQNYAHIINRRKIIPFLVLLEYLVTWIVLHLFKFPSILFDSYFYMPGIFADSLHNSIGELFTNTSFILFASYSLLVFKNRNEKKQAEWNNKTIALILFLVVLFVTAFLVYETTVISLFKNSKISIEFGQDFVSDRAATIIAFVVTASLSLSLYFLGTNIFKRIFSVVSGKKSIYLVIFSLVLVFLAIRYLLGDLKISSFIFFLTLSFTYIFFSNVINRITTIQILSFLLLFSLYLGFLSTYILQGKELEQRRLVAETIANDRDSMAEFGFEKIIDEILSDPILNQMINEGSIENSEYAIINRIYNYFRENENSLKYIPFVTICDSTYLLTDRLENYSVNCVSYFNKIIADIGISTNRPNLFFINNYSINNSYIIRFIYPETNVHPTRFVFIELGSELIPEGLGYPELLIDETSNISGTELVNYSFAKYMDDELVYNFGDYFYSLNLQNYKDLALDQDNFDNNEYNHIIVNKDQRVSFIISKENKDLIETLAPFSYFFLFLAAFLAVFFLITIFSFKIFTVQISFRNRLQYTLLSIILTSFVVIGVTTMLYLIHLNDKKNHEILSEKAHSVLIELEHKLAGEQGLGPELYETLNAWLVKFSLVFFSDINLYSVDGKLIASSRMQIFDEGLLSRLMNVKAYSVLANKEKMQFIQNEKIGNYEYLSAYVPLRNTENKIVAYLNLPYFARQTELQIEITNFLVALVNIYVLFFIIALMVTILISKRISKPLQLIRNSLSGIRLGKANEKIDWSRQDEIGGLVAEYNRMIDELSNSALLLVRSEREGAWREMAKQVAHEIKNPLTPMKLSVQYLKKAWDENEKDWDKRLARFTKTIIEQIDSLSEIANAFSDFAKMPVQKSEQVDLKYIINNSIELFKENTDVKYVLYLPEDKYLVKADKNQMLRVFNNLIKNSIQAIGSKKDGQVTISVKKSQKEMIVVIADNGTGIPQEMADKIFSPSFTTKSSGMGLGLAIVKNIVLNAGGNIWFESKAKVGTTFYISLPYA